MVSSNVKNHIETGPYYGLLQMCCPKQNVLQGVKILHIQRCVSVQNNIYSVQTLRKQKVYVVENKINLNKMEQN